MTNPISIIEELEFSLGTVEVQEAKEYSALKNHYIRQVKENNFGVDKIYFSGEFPSVYFKSVSYFDEDTHREILSTQKKVWNQGKVPFLFVEGLSEIRIYSCYEKPVKFEQEDRTIQDLEIYQTVFEDLSELKRVFNKVSIETGRFWKENKYSRRVRNEHRIERELIKNLRNTREELKKDGLPVSIIHNLLLRSLFILYLEDRKATGASFYQRITGLSDISSYFEILENKEGTYRLFAELEEKFNGNLGPVDEDEERQVKEFHLRKIKNCFWAEIREGGQLKLFDWRLFDFEVIPIQLLSEIYEEFLEEEDEEGKSQAGAFYTPHPLAEFVLNEILPYPTKRDNRFDLKVLDPTCGSGIFLVESLNRLLDRWEDANPEKKLSYDVICKITQENIFGIEINPEAIKVAAFSLYLAMLNRLAPRTLWQNKRFPYLIYDPNEKDHNRQGGNLFLMSSLGNGPFEDIDFNLVVGNPPFKRGGLKEEEQVYLQERNFAQELVLAFLDRVTTIAPNAKYGLVCGSKPVLFNNGIPYQNFRRFLFNENYVDKVFNFSILRRVAQREGGRNLFTSAVSPISVVFYSKQFPEDISDKLIYCAPKTAIKNRIIDGIAIDKTDIKYLPREECKRPDTKIWKAAMWGTERDFQLTLELDSLPKLRDQFRKEEYSNWSYGNGYQTSSPSDKIDSEISALPTIQTKYIENYYSRKDNLSSTPTKFRRFGTKETYFSPHLILKKGLKNNRVCASYLDYDCAFRDGCYGINAPVSQSNELKFLTAYLNSSLVSYFLFLNISSLGVEREQIMLSEYFQLPDILEKSSSTQISKVAKLVDKIILLKKNFVLDEELKIQRISDRIDTIIYDIFDLEEYEIIHIESLIKNELSAFLDKDRSLAYYPCSVVESGSYVKYLCQVVNQFLDYDSDITTWASIFRLSPSNPLNVVVLYFNKIKAADTILELPEKEVGQILNELEAYTYREYAESIYYRRFLRFYADDKLYIIKPNEKRFWSPSMGINDADEIIAEMLNQ